MHNKAMERKLQAGDCIDLSKAPREDGYFVLDSVREGADYCDAASELWIWSIGRRISDGKILASTSADLYQNPRFECLWLR